MVTLHQWSISLVKIKPRKKIADLFDNLDFESFINKIRERAKEVSTPIKEEILVRNEKLK